LAGERLRGSNTARASRIAIAGNRAWMSSTSACKNCRWDWRNCWRDISDTCTVIASALYVEENSMVFSCRLGIYQAGKMLVRFTL
jgi:hypothetical protein